MKSNYNKKYSSNNIIVYIDFDGTITLKDIGDELFKHFGEFELYHNQLVEKKITISQYLKSVCYSIKNDTTLFDISKYCENAEIDSNFVTFVNYCNNNNIEIYIISDGFDVYINSILKKNNLDFIKYYSNKLQKSNNGMDLELVLNYRNEACSCQTALCKRNVVLSNTEDDTIIVYIGDGVSDYCVSEYADIVFAKKKLAAYCNEYNVPHYPFDNFFDIYITFQKIYEQKKYKIRHQARLSRKKAFEVE